jgi:hypothetical protein
LLLQTTAAVAANSDNEFAVKGAGLLPCGIYTKAREDRSNLYYMIGGWIEGYLSAHNRYADDTYDIMSFESLKLLLNVVDNHCQANPTHRLHAVMNAVIAELQPDRLREASARVKISEDGREVALHRETIARMQSRLSELGLYKAKADGRFTEETKSALIAFQSDIDFEKTGFPDQATLWRLLRK